jgi:Caudovirus prohead serine protease
MFDPDRTVVAVLLSGGPVRRAGVTCWFEISEGAVDLDDAVGCPMLDDHGDQLGDVTDLWIKDGQLRGELSFAETIAGEAALRLVKAGEITGISIGNRIDEWTEVDPGVYVATEWTLLEASLCEQPLDRGAHTHGYGIKDVRARMLARQRMVERTGAPYWSCRYDDDLDAHGLIRASVRVPDPRLVLHAAPGPLL